MISKNDTKTSDSKVTGNVILSKMLSVLRQRHLIYGDRGQSSIVN
jgi:hypothetical protein